MSFMQKIILSVIFVVSLVFAIKLVSDPNYGTNGKGQIYGDPFFIKNAKPMNVRPGANLDLQYGEGVFDKDGNDIYQKIDGK